MLTATYNTPASDWTRAIDAALAAWSRHVLGDATLRIKISLNALIPNLAMCSENAAVTLGRIKGTEVALPTALARLQGYVSNEVDFSITINPTFRWHFGATPQSGSYWAIGVMMHEIGHGLYQTGLDRRSSPYELWKAGKPAGWFASINHFNDVDGVSSTQPLMSQRIDPGAAQHITDFDLDCAAACGVPTSRGSTIYVVPGGKVRGTAKDVAVWLGTFSAFNAQITGITRLEMRGDGTLTAAQADLYRLYRAAFGRIPDLSGFRWWAGQNANLDHCAASFVQSDEFRRMYAGVDREQLVRRLYRNILGRDPDPSGLAWWLQQSHMPDWRIVAGFALAPENKIGTPTFIL